MIFLSIIGAFSFAASAYGALLAIYGLTDWGDRQTLIGAALLCGGIGAFLIAYNIAYNMLP